jgi:hypothetical protein
MISNAVVAHGWAPPIGGSVMTAPDRAASPARRDAASSSIPDQLLLARLARLLVLGALATLAFVALAPLVEAVGFFTRGNHRLRSPPRPTFEDAR